MLIKKQKIDIKKPKSITQYKMAALLEEDTEDEPDCPICGKYFAHDIFDGKCSRCSNNRGIATAPLVWYSEEFQRQLAEYEKRIGDSKSQVNRMIKEANDQAEKNVIKSNEIFHKLLEVRKKNTEEKIKQLKNQAIKDIKNASINIAFESVEKLLINSIDKAKLDKIYSQSIQETKLALQKKSS